MSRSIKSILYFISGAAFWEAIAHIHLQLLGMIPFTVFGVLITPSVNMMIILFAFALSAFLVAVASRLSCDCYEE